MTYEWTDCYILAQKLLDILAAIPDGESIQNVDDSDTDSNSDDDVEFDNLIDIIFDDSDK